MCCPIIELGFTEPSTPKVYSLEWEEEFNTNSLVIVGTKQNLVECKVCGQAFNVIQIISNISTLSSYWTQIYQISRSCFTVAGSNLWNFLWSSTVESWLCINIRTWELGAGLGNSAPRACSSIQYDHGWVKGSFSTMWLRPKVDWVPGFGLMAQRTFELSFDCWSSC